MMKTQVNRVATRGRWIGVLALLGVVTTPLTAPAQTLTATEIVARSQEAFLAAGDDMRARLTMRLINKGGRERLREMTMLRIDLEGGDHVRRVHVAEALSYRRVALRG